MCIICVYHTIRSKKTDVDNQMRKKCDKIKKSQEKGGILRVIFAEIIWNLSGISCPATFRARMDILSHAIINYTHTHTLTCVHI